MTITVEDLVNQALRRTSYAGSIGTIYDGSPAAQIASEVYAQTRDALFGEKDWPFARQTVALGSPIKSAPPGGYGVTAWTTAYPPPPWQYEYAYPDDCIEVRALRPTPSLIPEYSPRPYVFVAAYDAALAQKVVLANLSGALAVITARVTDPNEWQDSNFIDALIDRLASEFTKAFDEQIDKTVFAAREARAAEIQADARRG